MANKPFFVPKKEISLIDSLNEEFIDELVGHKALPNSTEDKITIKNTTKKDELTAAIKKQKKFIKGKVSK